MSYSSYANFSEWSDIVSPVAIRLLTSIEDGERQYQKWYAMTYGLDDASVLALPQFVNNPGITVSDITKLRFALGAFHDFYNAMHGLAVVPQRDRQTDLSAWM